MTVRLCPRCDRVDRFVKFVLSLGEKNEVHQFLRFSIKNRLKGPDSRLPSVLFISDLVKRGLAVHHAGMLPLLKEVRLS